MTQCPSMVAEYLKWSTNTEYDVVQLLAAFGLKGTHQSVNHGSMTEIIRYKTPYFTNNTSPLIFTFVLCTDVALRSVFGIPCLLAMGTVVNLVKYQLISSDLNKEFPLQLDRLGKGLPDGATFDSFSIIVPDGYLSDAPTLGCLPLKYTASYGTIAPVS